MFSDHIKSIENKISSLNFNIKDVEKTLEKAENGEKLSLKELGDLLAVEPQKDMKLYSKILSTSRQMKEKIFNSRVFPIVPIYVTSICREHCKYCNYRVENKDKEITRIRLTNSQLQEEIEHLVLKKGLRVVELVYGSDPQVIPKIPDHIKLANKILDKVGGGMVAINAEPFKVEEYKILKKAGLHFVVLWQETYQRDYYRKLHPDSTPKADFDNRIDDFERMIRAEINNIGIGVLSGLAPWRRDWLLLIAHEMFLFENYGILPSIVGIPRLKPASGAQVKSTPFIPTDKEFLLAVAVHNIFSPDSLPFVNSREEWRLCLELGKGGGTLFTFNCATIPGGYVLGKKGYQFPTFDFDVARFLQKIKSEGLNPIFNWQFDKNNVPAVRC